MGRTAKRPRRLRSCRFTLVRDATLKKVDSNTRKIHSQFVLLTPAYNFIYYKRTQSGTHKYRMQ